MTNLAHYRCLHCGHEWHGKPGPATCPTCPPAYRPKGGIVGEEHCSINGHCVFVTDYDGRHPSVKWRNYG